MTRLERLLTPSAAACCLCGHELSLQELQEYYDAADDGLHGDAYCRPCMERYLLLCRECSGRYTTREVCGECRG